MQLKSTLLAAGAALVLTAGAASAAVVRTDLNLRSGPGTEYSVIDTMPAGARVAVLGCSGSWCRVDFHGERGFAASNLIGGGGGYAINEGYAPNYYDNGYAYDYGPDYYDYGPGVVFGFGGYYGGRHHHHHHGNGHGRHNYAYGNNNGVPAARTAPTNRGASFSGNRGGRSFGAAPSARMNGTVGAGPSMNRGGAVGGGANAGGSAGGANAGGGASIGGGANNGHR